MVETLATAPVLRGRPTGVVDLVPRPEGDVHPESPRPIFAIGVSSIVRIRAEISLYWSANFDRSNHAKRSRDSSQV